MLVGFFIRGGHKSVIIVCTYYYTKKWNFIIDVDFLCKIENRNILKGLLCCVNFISTIGKKEYIVSIFSINVRFIDDIKNLIFMG